MEKENLKYTTIRIPIGLANVLKDRAQSLERVLDTSSEKYTKKIYLPGGRHERFGIAPWQIVARAIRELKLKEERQRRFRQRCKSKDRRN